MSNQPSFDQLHRQELINLLHYKLVDLRLFVNYRAACRERTDTDDEAILKHFLGTNSLVGVSNSDIINVLKASDESVIRGLQYVADRAEHAEEYTIHYRPTEDGKRVYKGLNAKYCRMCHYVTPIRD